MSLLLHKRINEKRLSASLDLLATAQERGIQVLAKIATNKDEFGNLPIHLLAQHTLKNTEGTTFETVLGILSEVEYGMLSNSDGVTPRQLAEANETFDDDIRVRFPPIPPKEAASTSSIIELLVTAQRLIGHILKGVVTAGGLEYSDEQSAEAYSRDVLILLLAHNLHSKERAMLIDLTYELGESLRETCQDRVDQAFVVDAHQHFLNHLLAESEPPKKVRMYDSQLASDQATALRVTHVPNTIAIYPDCTKDIEDSMPANDNESADNRTSDTRATKDAKTPGEVATAEETKKRASEIEEYVTPRKRAKEGDCTMPIMLDLECVKCEREFREGFQQRQKEKLDFLQNAMHEFLWTHAPAVIKQLSVCYSGQREFTIPKNYESFCSECQMAKTNDKLKELPSLIDGDSYEVMIDFATQNDALTKLNQETDLSVDITEIKD
jgi:hypothetical protein